MNPCSNVPVSQLQGTATKNSLKTDAESRARKMICDGKENEGISFLKGKPLNFLSHPPPFCLEGKGQAHVHQSSGGNIRVLPEQ